MKNASGIEEQLQDMTRNFVNELMRTIRDTFTSVVGDMTGVSRSVPRPNGVVRAPTGAQATRRSSEETEKIAQRVATFVNTQPEGVRVNIIGKQLNLTTAQLMLPIAKALASKQISRVGDRRATTYLPAKVVPVKSAAKLAAKPTAKPVAKPVAKPTPKK